MVEIRPHNAGNVPSYNDGDCRHGNDQDAADRLLGLWRSMYNSPQPLWKYLQLKINKIPRF
jgi:hypothetical protein